MGVKYLIGFRIKQHSVWKFNLGKSRTQAVRNLHKGVCGCGLKLTFPPLRAGNPQESPFTEEIYAGGYVDASIAYHTNSPGGRDRAIIPNC